MQAIWALYGVIIPISAAVNALCCSLKYCWKNKTICPICMASNWLLFPLASDKSILKFLLVVALLLLIKLRVATSLLSINIVLYISSPLTVGTSKIAEVENKIDYVKVI
jgi:hypothetical protein